MDYIRDYCLILDEELSTIEPHKITCDDLKIMQEQELLQIDPDTKQLVWMDDSYKGEYKRHMEAVKRQDLFELAPNQVFGWSMQMFLRLLTEYLFLHIFLTAVF